MMNKKVISLAISLVMVFAFSTFAFAQTYSIDIVYNAEDNGSGGSGSGPVDSYTVTVPQSLTVKSDGTSDVAQVKAWGSWASNQTLAVSAPNTLTLTNDGNSASTVDVNVSFSGIEQKGNDYAAVATEENPISADISITSFKNGTAPVFGTWTGTIVYTVKMETAPAAEKISFSIDGISYQAEQGMTWEAWVVSDYNTDGFILHQLDEWHVFTSNKSHLLLYSSAPAQYVVKEDVIVSGHTYSWMENL